MTLRDLALSHPGILLAIAQTILVFVFVNYALFADPLKRAAGVPVDSVGRFWAASVPVRALVAFVLVFAIAPIDGHSAVVAGFVVMASILLPVARRYWVPAVRAAELEMGAVILCVAGVVALEIHWGVLARRLPGHIPIPETRIAALLLILAMGIFSLRGGTHIVRGVLNKCGALPPLSHKASASDSWEDSDVDRVEFNRGRWIGNLERILLLAITAEPNYQAIAFLIAAKTLIRSKDLEDRAWAEYFLLGTLASVAVALFCGFTIRRIVVTFW